MIALKIQFRKAIDRRIVHDFNNKKHLQELKAKRRIMIMYENFEFRKRRFHLYPGGYLSFFLLSLLKSEEHCHQDTKTRSVTKDIPAEPPRSSFSAFKKK